MMPQDKVEAGCGCIALIGIAIAMAVTGALYYAAFHFIAKYW
jgi:L-serine deaminase